MAIIGVWAALLVVAAIIEAALEYVFGIWWQPWPDPDTRKKILMAIGAILGIFICVFYKIDVVYEMMSQVGYQVQTGIVGYVISGLIAGRGSEFVHSFILLFINLKNGTTPPPAPPVPPVPSK
jgi:hypothetical protein